MILSLDSEDETGVEELPRRHKVKKSIWDTILMSVVGMASTETQEDVIATKNGSVQSTTVSGKHHEDVQGLSLTACGESLSVGSSVAQMIQANVPLYEEVLPGLESWQTSKIASWQSLEGHSIQWFFALIEEVTYFLFPPYIVNNQFLSLGMYIYMNLRYSSKAQPSLSLS